ncbi:MAG: hypothetical protein ACJ76J_25920, partial [Thermoanaerobaculia bacterium]
MAVKVIDIFGDHRLPGAGAFVHDNASQSASPPSRLHCWIANTLSLARFPWDRWRLAGILKTLGRKARPSFRE